MFIPSQDLLPWIEEILNHCTPNTKDKTILNTLSMRQIADSTYLENALPKLASDANLIVPRSLYECKTNQVWRYPPHIYSQFKVIGNENTVISMKVRFAIPRLIQYGERKYTEVGKKKSVSRHSKTKPSIELPEDFGRISLFGTNYDMKLDGQMQPTSVKPEQFEYLVEFKIRDLIDMPTGEKLEKILTRSDPTEVVVKKFDAYNNQIQSTDQIGESLDLGFESLANNIAKENIKIGYIQLVHGPSEASILVNATKIPNTEGEYKLSVRLTNDDLYNRNPPRAAEWMRRSLILPHLYIKIRNGELLLPIQQHYESIQYAVNKDEFKLATEYDEKSYIQINGVLTRSVIDNSILCLSTFGVYDTINETPIEGPSVSTLLKNDESFFENLDLLSNEEKQRLWANPSSIRIIKAVLAAAIKAFNVKNNLHKFQWHAIQNRIKMILNDEVGTTTIVKAPTASGKTLVFMVNAALYSLLKNQRSVMVFPTRILNEDMFRKLTKFVYEMRLQISDLNITGGIYIGQSDPLYKALSNPSMGKVMIQFDTCPKCGMAGTILAKSQGDRKVGECSNETCGHKITYMFGPREVTDYLPTLTIATPDNLFYYSTNAGYERNQMRFFGGYFIKCSCGYCEPLMGQPLQTIQCKKCGRILDAKDRETSPIGYFVFDEVHSLHGLAGILLSIYLKAVEIAANKIKDEEYIKKPLRWQSTFETGTATIANEIDLLQAITRVPKNKIRIVPETKNHLSYFNLERDSVKYRTVLMLPIAKAAISSVSNALLRSYFSIHLDKEFSRIIHSRSKNAYDFILGYIFRKTDGYTLRRTIRDLANQELHQNLNIEFLSGDASTSDIAKLFQMAKNGKLRMLLANLIISLGIDIANLNNIIMMGMPKSMTEFVQTAGRTGRGISAGHTVVHLLPSNPRDMYSYENFHKVFSDVSGYFETKPIQRTNAYAARIIFPNILKLMLAAQSYHRYVLSINYANTYFSYPPNQRFILLDVLKALTDTATSESTRKTILEEANRELMDILSKWAKITGSGNYVSDWFRKEGHILSTFRENTDKDIPVEINDAELYNMMIDQFKTPWIDYSEDEVLDNDIDEEEQN